MAAVAEYKGKKYRYIDTFAGKDRRKWVKMQWFSDATKEFVAPADQVTVRADSPRRGGYRNEENYTCRCARPIDEGDGECMLCGYQIR